MNEQTIADLNDLKPKVLRRFPRRNLNSCGQSVRDVCKGKRHIRTPSLIQFVSHRRHKHFPPFDPRAHTRQRPPTTTTSGGIDPQGEVIFEPHIDNKLQNVTTEFRPHTRRSVRQ